MLTTNFPKTYFNVIHPPPSQSSMWQCSKWLPYQNFVYIPCLPQLSYLLNLLDFTILTILYDLMNNKVPHYVIS